MKIFQSCVRRHEVWGYAYLSLIAFAYVTLRAALYFVPVATCFMSDRSLRNRPFGYAKQGTNQYEVLLIRITGDVV